MRRREEGKKLDNFLQIVKFVKAWECWVKRTYYQEWGTAWTHRLDVQCHNKRSLPLGTHPDDLGYLLRFTAFWVDKIMQRQKWKQASSNAPSEPQELVGAGR